jgi:putative ABC transport system permease protein
MNLTAGLTYSQLRINRNRTFLTIVGIALSTAMITAVSGFIASTDVMFKGLLGESNYYTSLYNEMLLGLGAVFGSIIIAASVIVMSNAFRVSAGERIRQFGILKSVGATKRQIAQIIIYEALLLAAVAIPAGIALGLLVNFIGIQIMDDLLAAANRRNTFQIDFDFVVTWQALIISIVLSFVTVWMSAWIPARKAAKMAAIDAIRGTGEIKIKAKNVRGGRFIGRLFGFEGALAYKSLKRSRRNFRATVLSLTTSIILFIVVGSFGEQYKETTRLYYPGVENANVVCTFLPPEETKPAKGGNETKEHKYTTLDSILADEITLKLREYPNTNVFCVGDDVLEGDYNSYKTAIPKEMLTSKMLEFLTAYDYLSGGDGYLLPVTLCIADAENYAKLCKRAGVPLGSNILVNYARIPGGDGEGKSIFEPFEYAPEVLYLSSYGDSKIELHLDGVLEIRDVPNEIAAIYVGNVTVIVPRLSATRCTWFADTRNTEGFTKYANEVLHDMIRFEGSSEYIEVKNTEEVPFEVRDISRLIMVFIYGFITMLTLIGLTNVVSTISTNIRSRTHEFAVLRSIGMTPAGLNRMLNLESLLCSLKSLVFGVPLGILGSYLLYRSLVSPVKLDYAIPWTPIFQCMFGVIAVTWIIMRYSIQTRRTVEPSPWLACGFTDGK